MSYHTTLEDNYIVLMSWVTFLDNPLTINTLGNSLNHFSCFKVKFQGHIAIDGEKEVQSKR